MKAKIPHRAFHGEPVSAERWVRDVKVGFADRILPATLPVTSTWGRQQYAHPLPAVDGLLAATAQAYGFTLVTRNVRDFQRSGARVVNPFAV